MRFTISVLLVLLSTVTARAEPPEHSRRPVAREAAIATVPAAPVRPRARPVIDVPATAAETSALADAIATVRLRPQARPPSEQDLNAAAISGTVSFISLESSARPWLRPASVVEEALARRRMRRKGAVCGNIEIQGERVGRVPAQTRGCGIKSAVRLRSVAGVSLSQQALVNCDTAQALHEWITTGLKPAFGRADPVVKLRVAAHYACRTRNSRKGAKISEHGKGNAIDISAFTLRSGKTITVLQGWGQSALKKAHRAACGPFGTVLGPNADRFHRDHFHFDVARHRGGAFCR